MRDKNQHNCLGKGQGIWKSTTVLGLNLPLPRSKICPAQSLQTTHQAFQTGTISSNSLKSSRKEKNRISKTHLMKRFFQFQGNSSYNIWWANRLSLTSANRSKKAENFPRLLLKIILNRHRISLLCHLILAKKRVSANFANGSYLSTAKRAKEFCSLTNALVNLALKEDESMILLTYLRALAWFVAAPKMLTNGEESKK